MDTNYAKKSQKRRVQAEVHIRQQNVHEQKQLERSMSPAQAETLETTLTCECSNSSCNEKIVLSLRERQKLRQNPKHFIIVRGHTDHEIEKVVGDYKQFLVVEKFTMSV